MLSGADAKALLTLFFLRSVRSLHGLHPEGVTPGVLCD
jgi:hypothetical protein